MKSIVIPLGMAMLFSCSNDMKNLQQLSVQKKFPQGEAYDFKLVYTDSSKVVAVLTSPLNKDFSNQQMPYSEFPEGVKVEFYDHKKLNTPQLFWDQKEDWIFTDREFTFTDTKKGTVTKGIGMDFDKKFSTVKAHKTTGILSIEDKDE